MALIPENLKPYDKQMNEHLQGRIVNNFRADELEGARKATEVFLFGTNRIVTENGIKTTMRKFEMIADIYNRVHGEPGKK